MIGDILQPTHLLFILVVALLVLGPKRLPEVGRALGRGMRDFRNALNTDELRDQIISTDYQDTTPVEQEPTTPSETPVATEPGAGSATTPDSDQASSSPASSAEPDTKPEPEPEAEPAGSTPAPHRST